MCCLLFVVCCVLRFGGCLLFVVCCVLLCVCDLHVACVVRWLVLVVCCAPLLGASCVLMRVVYGCCSLAVVGCSWRVVRCVLFVVCCVLCVVDCG